MIHPSAVIHPKANIDPSCRIGPFAVIGEGVVIEAGCTIGPHTVIEGDTHIGRNCIFYPHAVLGTPPQDVKYHGEPTKLAVGERCIFREGATANRGTEHGGGITAIGNGCYFMANSHVAHDCKVGNEVVMANGVALAGHVTVEDYACFGGMAGVHQFARIGKLAFIGAGAMVRQDVAPFTIAKGDRAMMVGINRIGMERRDFPTNIIDSIEQQYGVLVRIGLERGIKRLEEDASPGDENLQYILDFIKNSQIGLCRFRG